MLQAQDTISGLGTQVLASRPIDKVLARLRKVKRTGDRQYQAECPCHHDEHASLSVKEAEDGRVLITCHAGCETESILKELGLGWPDLYPDQGEIWGHKDERPQARVTATYNYTDEQGELLYQVLRYVPKTFRHRRPDGRGGYVWNLQGVRRVLYRLPQVQEAIREGRRAFKPEGEKDVESLVKLGLDATTNAGGAAGWLDDYSESLRGARVVILPDNDEPGRKHAELVAKSLFGKAAEIKILELPNLPPKGDVSDWLATGGTREELERLAAEAPAWGPRDDVEDPLPRPKDQVEPFPVEVLPAALAQFVREAAEAIPCPPDFIGLPLLVLAGAVIGTSRTLEIKSGWREGPRLYGVIVAEPGSAKSPALDLVATPIYERQRMLATAFEEAEAEHKAEMARYEVEARAWEDRARSAAKGKGTDPGDKPEEPEAPKMGRLFTSDVTVEALATLIRDNPRGLALIRDELTGWVRSMNAYRSGHGADRQFYLSTWSGAPYPVDRKSGPPLMLFNPFLGVVGCIPPDLLEELTDERGREDGFVHRLMFAYPDPVPRRWTEAAVSQEARTAWKRALDDLWRLTPSTGEDGKPIPVAVRFTDAGKRTWVDLCETHYAEAADPCFPGHLRGAWAKLDGYCARLSLILHELRFVCGEAGEEAVDDTSVTGAWVLVEYLKSHMRRVYRALRADGEDKRVEGAVKWIEARGGECAARDLIAARIVKKRSEAEALFRELEDRGFGHMETRKPPRGREANVFTLAS